MATALIAFFRTSLLRVACLQALLVDATCLKMPKTSPVSPLERRAGNLTRTSFARSSLRTKRVMQPLSEANLIITVKEGRRAGRRTRLPIIEPNSTRSNPFKCTSGSSHNNNKTCSTIAVRQKSLASRSESTPAVLRTCLPWPPCKSVRYLH